MRRSAHKWATTALVAGALAMLTPVSAMARDHGYHGGGYHGGYYGGGYGYRGGYHHGGNWVAGAVAAGVIGGLVYSATRPDPGYRTTYYNTYPTYATPAYTPYPSYGSTTTYYYPAPVRRVVVEQPPTVYYTPGY